MADIDGNGGSKAGPWDVVLYLVKRSPLFALAVLLLGAGLFGAKVTLEERNKAEKELLEARQAIQTERNASRQAIDDLRERTRLQLDQQRQDVANALAQAAEKEKAAAAHVAEAKAQALLEVQDTLITASERIQNLVLGQLKSMDDLEKLHTLAAQELKSELADLQNRRDEMQMALNKAERKVRVARVTFAVDSLAKTLENSPYSVDDAIMRVIDSFDAADQDSLEEIKKRISQDKDPKLRGSLQYALALKTSMSFWAEQFASTLDNDPEAFGEGWFDAMFGCCEDISEPLWTTLLPVVSRLAVDEKVEISARVALLNFFDRRPKAWRQPLFFEEVYADREDLWHVLAFIISIARGDHRDLPEYERANTPEFLASLDLAAAHVWADWLVTESDLANEYRLRVKEFLDNWQEDYPVFGSAPSQELSAFWMNTDLMSNRGNYYKIGTNEAYGEPQN